METPLHLSIVAEPAALVDIRRQVQGYLVAAVDQRCIDDVKLAVHELVANSIVHAYVGRAPGLVDITVSLTPSRICICVRDFGRGDSAHPDSPGAGLGRGLLAMLGEEVIERRPESGGHEVTVRLRRAHGELSAR
jgi:anti-sigma regulatory factor (Ser/Thr protein kinase)